MIDRLFNFMLMDGGMLEIAMAMTLVSVFYTIGMTLYLREKLTQVKRIKDRFKRDTIPKSFFTRWEKEKIQGDYKMNDGSID